MLSRRHFLKIQIKTVYHKSVCRQSARNGILPSYAFLKLFTDVDSRIVEGSEFQSVAPLTEKIFFCVNQVLYAGLLMA